MHKLFLQRFGVAHPFSLNPTTDSHWQDDASLYEPTWLDDSAESAIQQGLGPVRSSLSNQGPTYGKGTLETFRNLNHRPRGPSAHRFPGISCCLAR
jgi:hypothetical protein